MIRIGNKVISDELFTLHFCCDLSECKGKCCVEDGDSGAPITEDEKAQIERILPKIWEDLSDRAKRL